MHSFPTLSRFMSVFKSKDSKQYHKMKKTTTILLLAICFSFLFQSCTKDNCTALRTTYVNTSVLVKEANLHPDPVVESPRELKKPGKIYYYNDYLLINEIHQGIHIFDNSNPTQPTAISFISIPGNVDMAIKSDVLYVDCYFDLLTIDVTDFNQPQFLNRVEDVREYYVNNNDEVVVYYTKEEVTREVPCNDNRNWGGVFENDATAPTSQSGNGTFGTGGSFARFTIVGDHLYSVDESNLTTFNISSPQQPTLLGSTTVGWGIETIYPYQDKLFLGSSDGMFIYDISAPSSPVATGQFNHARACDPVVVSGDYAYVTLRSGTWCEGYSDQLDLIDIRDVYNPKLVKTFQMKNPHGLAITEDNNLFVCEGEHGLKVFDSSNPEKLSSNRIDYVKDMHAYDVIALPNNHLLMIGNDGFYQYDYSNPKSLKEVSHIPVTR